MDHGHYLGPPSDASLKDIAAIAWRRKWIILLVMAASLGTTYYLHTRMKPRYRATAQMILVQRTPAASNSPGADIAPPMVESPATQEQMIASSEMAFRTVNWLRNESNERKITVEQLLAELGIVDDLETILRNFPLEVSVNIPKETNLIEVTVTSHSPTQAAGLANAICNAFIDWKREIAQASVREMIKNLETRAGIAKKRLMAAENREKDFKQRRHLVDVPTQQADMLNRYVQRESEVAALKKDLVTQKARLRSLGARFADANEAIKNGEFVRDDGLVISLQAQLNQLEIDLARAELIFTDEYQGPDGPTHIKARIQDVKERLRKAIQATLDNKRPSLQTQGALLEAYNQAQTELLAMESKYRAAVQMRDELKRETAALPATSLQAARLAREVELARTAYASLQTALNSAAVRIDQVDGNVQTTSPAYEPAHPFEPNLQKNLMTGGLLGVGIAVACALLFEHSDRRLRSVKDVRRMVSGPIIGTLPRMSRRQIRNLVRDEASPLAIEAYGLARANLALAMRNAGYGDPWQNQVILVTSAVPGEGKSVTAAAIARSIARAGKNVILVDADMRRPSQNRLFNTEEPNGLADVLTGEMSVEEALVASDTENLSILHSGHPPRNPTELISRPQMTQTLEALRKEADVVVVDAPACSAVADALLIAPHVDCILYVIGMGQAKEDIVQDTMAALSAAAPKTMVYFVNRAPRERDRYYKYYYAHHQSHRADLRSERMLTDNEEEQTEVIIPQDDDQPVARPGTATLILEGKGSRLVALEGPYAGQTFVLTGTHYVTIGRKAENSIALNLDTTVSRHHAHLVEENGRFVLYDDGSANGTFVNDIQITRQVLIPGDIVQFGASKFRYE